MDYRTINPTTGDLVETYATATPEEVERALDRAVSAFDAWSKVPGAQRAEVLLRVADALEAEAASLAALMAFEMGKPMAEGQAEAQKCAWVCRYYGENATALLEPEPRESDGAETLVRAEPLGPILAIMPWNFPFWQFFRFAAAGLMTGNVVLLKHAPNTPRCALRIEELLRDDGAVPDLVQNLFLNHEQVAEVIADRRVCGVTLTGSTRAGRQVASIAGRSLKRLVLELGGSDPFIVFEDADLDRAVEAGIASRCMNNGQSCIAAKRFLVHASLAAPFRERFVAGLCGRPLGDPVDPRVLLGPLARQDLRDLLARQVAQSVSGGAKLLCGGREPSRAGFFYEPTVLEDAPPQTPAGCEELFGPVATLQFFRDDDQAVALANDTVYGLGASLWTADRGRAKALAPRLDCGSVFVNGPVRSDPRLPFGGVKESGYGRELGREGLFEFVNLKTVWIG